MPRAGWSLDSVIVGVNDTSAFGFQDDFSSVNPDPFTWFLADTAVPRITCNSKGHALEFSTNNGLYLVLLVMMSKQPAITLKHFA